MKCLWEYDMVKSWYEFNNGCVPMHGGDGRLASMMCRTCMSDLVFVCLGTDARQLVRQSVESRPQLCHVLLVTLTHYVFSTQLQLIHLVFLHFQLTIAFLSSQDKNFFNPVEYKGNYAATYKLVHWPLMGRLLHLVQRWGDWAGPQPAQAPHHCTKCTNHCIAI